tara:strand:+ start:1000 stop:1539 length:540 start_codon:yes stop_codon:yes gene_type:complete
MLTVYSLNPDHRLSVTIAIFFAEEALSALEKQRPEDMRPRKAIEAAKEWLTNPCPSTSAAAYTAGVRAADASYDSITSLAASAAAYAAYTAQAQRNTAATAATTATTYAAYAANAAYHAVNASNGRKLYVHRKLTQLLPHLFEYKVYTKTSFEDSEQVFNLLSEENQGRFLFNPNCMVE